MKTIVSRISTSLFLGSAFALVFDLIFLGLLQRPLLDRALLLFFSMAAFGYLAHVLLQPGNGMIQSLRAVDFTFTVSQFISFLRRNIPGLLLALLFFCLYTYLGLRLNLSGVDTVDNFLDADNTSWILRIADPGGSSSEMRGPHPFAYFIFRPLGWMLNLFTRDARLSAILLNTFTGGLTVLLAWTFINKSTENPVYSLLIASLLGLSSAHMFFGSVVETYIFSAAVLIGFFLLLQSGKETTLSLVAASLLAFGITLTNFVQNFIGFVFSRPRMKDIVRFAGLTISISIVLSLIHSAWYPSSKLFFLPSDAQTEEEFAISVFNDPAWRALGRMILLIRTILLYTVIAPRPYVFGAEVGGTFPRFNFFRIAPGTYSYSSYDGLGNILVAGWAVLLLAGGILFIRDLVRTRKWDMRLAFVLCLLFNFILHLNYGYEPFLYSPDWAYALIFFVGLSLAPFARNRIFQGGLFVFLVLLAYNQLQFFQFILQTIGQFVG